MEAALQNDERYTYADMEKWCDCDTQYELFDGIPYAMAPPLRKHGIVNTALSGQLWTFLKDKSCELHIGDLGVHLNAVGDDYYTFYIPDIAVVCDKSKLDDKGCNGAPDLIIEILSPSTASRDWITKHQKYLKAGVREYWIVDPAAKMVYVNILSGGDYKVHDYSESDSIPVYVLEGCTINLSEIFSGI